MKFFALQRLHNNFFLHLTVCPFDFLSVHPPTDKYFMTRLFSCLRRSPHLQLTFIARFYTQQEMLRHTHTHTHTLLTLILSAPKGKAVTQAQLATTKKNKNSNRRTLNAPVLGDRRRAIKGRAEDTLTGEKKKPLFPQHPTVVSLPSHGQTTREPCPAHTASSVRAPTFSCHLRTLL